MGRDGQKCRIRKMHNAARYCGVGMDESCIVWEFNECEFLDAHSPAVTQTRPAIASSYFLAGPRWAGTACQASMREMLQMRAPGIENARSGLYCMRTTSDMPENGSKPRHCTSLSETRLIFCGRDISASFSCKLRQIERLFN